MGSVPNLDFAILDPEVDGFLSLASDNQRVVAGSLEFVTPPATSLGAGDAAS